jgi:pectate lyase
MTERRAPSECSSMLALAIAILVTLLPIGGALAATKTNLAQLLKMPPSWFTSPEAARFGSNIVSFQSEHGGWPKNTDTHSQPYAGTNPKSDLRPTFDNGATVDQLRFLARLCATAPSGPFRGNFNRGYNYILAAQYPHGGFPQSYPSRPDSYERHITFNDGSMVRVLRFLRESSTAPDYSFIPEADRQPARAAFDRGIECILRCQVRINGKLTAWCAQHNAQDFSPALARTYELPSLSGAESVEIVRLLMSLEKPEAAVIDSVQAAVAWFTSAQIEGIKVVRVPDPKSPTGTDKRVVADPGAPPLWARFYDLKTNEPIFCDRDGVPKRHLREIGYERRNGYAWLGDWPKNLLEKEYPEWRKRVSAK